MAAQRCGRYRYGISWLRVSAHSVFGESLRVSYPRMLLTAYVTLVDIDLLYELTRYAPCRLKRPRIE